MDLTSVTKLSSTLILASLIAFLMSAGPRPAVAQHTITVNNNCTDTVWVGAFPNVQSVTVGTTNVTTLGGWEMTTGQSATVQVPASWSGRFWARTGCSFNATGVCDSKTVKVNGTDYVIANCCDTGGCMNGSNFALNCAQTGLPPATLAELTVVSSGQDSYDVSMVDGGNVSVEIIPDSSTYDCTGNPNCINTANLPGTNSSSCTQDSDCYPLFGFGFKWKCDPNLKMCVNPFFCGSPGCTDTGGCAPAGLTQSVLPNSTWTGSGLAVSQANCPSDLQLTNEQNQGSTYVGCFAPQKFCRKSCSIDGDCGPPYTFNCGGSGFCEDSGGTILGADCDTAVSGTTNEDLWACAGVNSGSCFTTGTMDSNCCGCPTWAPGFPNAFPNGACVAGNNTTWQSVAQPVAAVFNSASPTSYAFPFDDAIKLFDCAAKSGSVTAYTVNFCPSDSDGDGVQNSGDSDADGDGITNTRETVLGTQTEAARNGDIVGTPNDADADGIENMLDLDSDNDGVPDVAEAGRADLDADRDGIIDDQTDTDGDGVPDAVDPDQGGAELIPIDSDGDDIPDTLDTNSDNDGGTDFEENDGEGDSDGDGLPDSVTDENGDGLLDIFDPDFGQPLVIRDSDGDGTPDFQDADGGNGGCWIAAPGTGDNSASLWLILPAIVLFRMLRRRTKKN
ncbi:MAG: thaumatin family protein [Deltaproteobacteria bacterium]